MAGARADAGTRRHGAPARLRPIGRGRPCLEAQGLMRWKPTRRRDLSARRFARRGPGWRRPQAIDWTFPSSLSTGRRRALSMSSPAARPPSVSNAHRPARRWWATVPTPRTWLAAAPSPARGELSRCRDDLPAFDERHAGGRPRAPDGGWPRCTIRQARPGGDGPVPVGLEVARSYPCRRQAGEEPLLAYARDPHKRVERRTQYAARPGESDGDLPAEGGRRRPAVGAAGHALVRADQSWSRRLAGQGVRRCRTPW